MTAHWQRPILHAAAAILAASLCFGSGHTAEAAANPAPSPDTALTPAGNGERAAKAAAIKKTPPPRPIDLNAANIKELEELPGIGKVTAKSIIDFRQKSGRIRRVEDLLVIRGISRRRLEAIRPYVTVGVAPAPKPAAAPAKSATAPKPVTPPKPASAPAKAATAASKPNSAATAAKPPSSAKSASPSPAKPPAVVPNPAASAAQ